MKKTRSVNVEVRLKPGESQEKLLKRFSKKCKKEEIIKEHLEKTSYFISKREKKRMKAMKNKWLRETKKSKKYENILTFYN